MLCAEAEELTALAKARGLVTAIGLQARVNPALLYMKELVDSGFVGEMMAVHVSMIRDGVLSRPSHRTWQRDVDLGANTLTIANGHTVDAMRFVTGDFTRLSAVVATQAKQWLDTIALVPPIRLVRPPRSCQGMLPCERPTP